MSGRRSTSRTSTPTSAASRGVWPPYRTGEEGFTALVVRARRGHRGDTAGDSSRYSPTPPSSTSRRRSGTAGDTFPIAQSDPRGATLRRPRPRPRPGRRRPSDAGLADQPRRRRRSGSISLARGSRDRPTSSVSIYYPGLLDAPLRRGRRRRSSSRPGYVGLDEVVRTYAAALRAAGDDHRDESWRHASKNAARWLRESLDCRRSSCVLTGSRSSATRGSRSPPSSTGRTASRPHRSTTGSSRWGWSTSTAYPGGGALERHPTALIDDFATAVRRGMPPLRRPTDGSFT